MAEFNIWLLMVGLVVGAAVTWLVIGTISRNDDDVAARERASEAAWIADTIEEDGGHAPAELVEQILLLHRRYLQGQATPPLLEDAVGGAQESAAASKLAGGSELAEASHWLEAPEPKPEPEPTEASRTTTDG